MLTRPFEITIAGWPSKETFCADANPAAANQSTASLKLSIETIIRYNPASVQIDRRVGVLHTCVSPETDGLNCGTQLK